MFVTLSSLLHMHSVIYVCAMFQSVAAQMNMADQGQVSSFYFSATLHDFRTHQSTLLLEMTPQHATAALAGHYFLSVLRLPF